MGTVNQKDAHEIYDVFQKLTVYLPSISCALFSGGGVPRKATPFEKPPLTTNVSSYPANVKFLKRERPQIIIGTLGRLSTLLKNGKMDISSVRHMVYTSLYSANLFGECEYILSQ